MAADCEAERKMKIKNQVVEVGERGERNSGRRRAEGGERVGGRRERKKGRVVRRRVRGGGGGGVGSGM